jgi:signal peptide peptidase SppA
MEVILQVLNMRGQATDYEARSRKTTPTSGDIAVIPIVGTLTQRPSAFPSGGVSTQAIGQVFDQAVADSSIGAIVFDIDSPGGSVFGVQELSEKIFNARGSKPIIAVANSLMASAAFWVGTAADEVVAAPGADVGSVGVLAVHTDRSVADANEGVKTTIIKAGRFKAEANSAEPLTDEAHANIQARVDEHYNSFVSDLARNRGVSNKAVAMNFGEGRVLSPSNAMKAGMIDKVATLEQVIKGLQSNSARKRKVRAQFELRKRQGR